MTRKHILGLLLFAWMSVTLSASQSGGYPENYFEVLQQDLAAVPKKIETRDIAVPAVATMEATSADTLGFPEIKIYTVIHDSSGNHIEGLTPDAFDLYVKHELDRSVLGEKTAFSLDEVGAIESKADIVFIIDSTGSMSGQIDTVKNNVIAFVDKLVENNVSYQLAGFDYGDEVPYRSFHPFDTNATSFKAWVEGLYASGGDDWPENPLDAIISAGYLSYRPDAQQIIVLITDAPAHVAGDGGDSSTTATFSQAAAAIGDKTFYYFSDVDDYAALGPKLGGTDFDADALIGTLAGSITGKYIFTFKDPNDERDGRKRYVRIIHKETGTMTRIDYKADLENARLSGTVTNNDPEPQPLENVTVEAKNADGTRYTTATDASGKYTLEVPVGDYEVTASLSEYKDFTKSLTLKAPEEGEAAAVTLDMQLARSSIADEKNKMLLLARNIKAYGSLFNTPFSDEADQITGWVESLPSVADGDGSDPTDAQREGLKRLIAASLVLDKSNGYATEDAQKIGQSLGEVIVSLLTLTGQFDRLQTYIRNVVSLLPDSDSWLYGWAVSALKKTFNFVADKLGQLSVAISNTILDFINGAFPDNPTVGMIVTLTKDVINAADGKPAMTGIVTTYVTPWIGKQLITPFYADSLEPAWTASLDRSRGITAADFDAMASDLRKANAALAEMVADFEKLKASMGVYDSVKTYLTYAKNILDVIHKIDPVLSVAERLGATAPVALQIDAALTTVDKLLEGGNMIVSGQIGVMTATHLYGLSDTTKAGMEAAYGSLVTKLSTPTLTSAWQTYTTGTYTTPRAVDLTTSCGDDTLADFAASIDSANALIDANNLEGFANALTDEIGPAFDCLTMSLADLKAKIDAGATLSDKPVNYDLLYQQAYDAYLSFQNDSLGYMINASSLILSSAMEATADGKFGADSTGDKEVLRAVMTEWKALAESTANTMATAANSVTYGLSSGAVVAFASLTADVGTLTDGVNEFNITATLKNLSDNDAADVTVALTLPKTIDTAALRSGVPIPRTLLRSTTINVDDLNQTVGTIPAGTAVEVRWTVRVDGDITQEAYNFIASVYSTSAGTYASGSRILSVRAKAADGDGDGMPDFWEKAHGLDPSSPVDRRTDIDKDGLNNYIEYLYDYDPARIDTFVGKDDLTTYLTLDDQIDMQGDLDGNGRLDETDYETAKAIWHTTQGDAGFNAAADLNGNGIIDVEDIMLIRHYVDAFTNRSAS